MMRYVLVVLLALVAAVAQAGWVYQSTTVKVEMFDVACTEKGLNEVLAPFGFVGVARVTFPDGSVRKACWSRDADDDFVVMDDSGHGGYLPNSEVHLNKEI